MKNKIIYFGVIIFAILVQTSFLPIIARVGVLGDAVLMLVLVLAVLDGFANVLKWAVLAGILYDFASYTTIGVHVIIFLLTVYVVSFFSRRLSVEIKGMGLFFLLLFVVLATLISNGLLSLFAVWGGKTLKLYAQAFGSFSLVIFQVFCNAVLLFFWFNVIKKIKKKFVL